MLAQQRGRLDQRKCHGENLKPRQWSWLMLATEIPTPLQYIPGTACGEAPPAKKHRTAAAEHRSVGGIPFARGYFLLRGRGCRDCRPAHEGKTGAAAAGSQPGR